MKKLISLLFLLAFFIAVIGLSPRFFPLEKELPRGNETGYEHGVISLANASVAVEIPLTKTDFEKGLGERDSLSENDGMLFLCLPDAYPKFWMKGMRFPIDIIWIDDTFIVVDITQNATPESFPDILTPTRPAAHALEVNAGFAVANGISAGTMVYGLGGSSCRIGSQHSSILK